MKHNCKICGHEWDARVRKPKQCPKCKRYNYQVEILLRKKEKEELKNKKEDEE